jgi:hypothetical protein
MKRARKRKSQSNRIKWNTPKGAMTKPDELVLADLLTAKALVDRVGSIENARAAVRALLKSDTLAAQSHTPKAALNLYRVANRKGVNPRKQK